MKKYIQYLKYVLKHKFYVAQECWKNRLYWKAITHDLSKFLPDEFIPYARYFYGDYKSIQEYNGDVRNMVLNAGCYKEKVKRDFDLAWLKHIHRNKHHWQHWILREDCGKNVILEMDFKTIMEMISDWKGAGKAINGKDDVVEWYGKNRDKMRLNESTRRRVDAIIKLLKGKHCSDCKHFLKDKTECGIVSRCGTVSKIGDGSYAQACGEFENA